MLLLTSNYISYFIAVCQDISVSDFPEIITEVGQAINIDVGWFWI